MHRLCTCGRCTSRLSQVFSTLVLRKAATVLSFGVAATFLLLAGYLPRDDHRGHLCAVAFLTLAVAGLGVGSAGWDVNALGAWAALFHPRVPVVPRCHPGSAPVVALACVVHATLAVCLLPCPR